MLAAAFSWTMLRRLARRLWLHTPLGRAQAERQRVLARLKSYCSQEIRSRPQCTRQSTQKSTQIGVTDTGSLRGAQEPSVLGVGVALQGSQAARLWRLLGEQLTDEKRLRTRGAVQSVWSLRWRPPRSSSSVRVGVSAPLDATGMHDVSSVAAIVSRSSPG